MSKEKKLTHVNETGAANMVDVGSKPNTERTSGKTGVEMEALIGASIAALTIYDMCKAVDRGMNFRVWLATKSGGQSGEFVFEPPPSK